MAGLKVATVQAYRSAWEKFARFDKPLEGKLDEQLVAYLESIKPEARRATAEKVISAVKHFFPAQAASLPAAARYLKQIKRQFLSNTKPPMVEDVLIMLVVELINLGFPTTALGVYVQFDCYLRPAELCTISAKHVLVSGDSVLGTCPPKVLIILPNTKTGPLQSVDLRLPILQLVLVKLLRISSPPQRLFPPYAVYARRVQKALGNLGLSYIGYTPHSIRHGAATMDLLKGGYQQLPAILYRGRWESNVGKRYLQMGAALLLDAQLPRKFVKQARIARQFVHNMLKGSSFTPGC